MKNRWLPLAAAVICLMALAPAVVLSQEPTLSLGCGSPTVNGRVDATEWANAATVTLWADLNVESRPEGATLSQGNDVPHETGTAYFLHDENYVYVGVVLEDPEDIEPDNPTEYDLFMTLAFEDEPPGAPGLWTDCLWDADSCAESGEGQLIGHECTYCGEIGLRHALFVPWTAEHNSCGEKSIYAVEDPPGVAFDLAPRGAEAHYEMRISLSDSPLSNVSVGDCFDLRWLWVYFSGRAADGSIVGFWPVDGVDEPDFTGECPILCLDPCVEFVPEPATLLLLGGGLMGLAGYATLRLRPEQAQRRGTKE